MIDTMDRLSRKAGRLNYDDMIKDRIIAAQEIRRLRSESTAMHDRWARRLRSSEVKAPMTAEAEKASKSNRLVRLMELQPITGLSRSTIYKLVKEGRCPKSFKLSTQASAWRLRDMLAWQESLGKEGI